MTPIDADYEQTIWAWRKEREDALRAEDGWLALAGLFWLRDGDNRVGTASGNEISLPAGSTPPRAGVLTLRGGQVTVRAESGVPLRVGDEPPGTDPLRPDTSGAPSMITLGRLKMVVIQRGERFGLRVWDRENPLRKAFPGRKWFPVDPRFRLTARFHPYDPPKPIRVENILGDVVPGSSPGWVILDLKGVECRLEVTSGDKDGLFLIFRDATSGESTYPAGRYLATPPPLEGLVELDFNRTYNPPCAFTPFATCPLPPHGNTIPHRIEAGERFPFAVEPMRQELGRE